MPKWWRWRLFRRRPLPRSIVSPSMLAYRVFETERKRIAQDIEDDPEMCLPLLGRQTRHNITRVIDQDETLAWWNDERRTQTMKTEIIEV